ncbi:MAG: pentapeptide repeat-containing protein [Methylocystaceae bacterium]|nr:pentapeptide repeat-containing protein [Methylocystaceae bacterium]
MADFDFGNYKVLMCDEDPDAIDIARTTYLEAGIDDFVATPSPEEALKHIPVMKPDVILVALKLQNTNGINVIQKIRSLNEGEFYKTPILMLLDKVSQNLLREACRAGIEGALRKPVSAAKILRFSRAVILKPRRFICVHHYFGPERRTRNDAHFKGKDRRNGSSAEDMSNGVFTGPRGVVLTPGRTKRSGEPILSNATRGSSSQDNSAPTDWGTSETKPKADVGVMDFSTNNLKGDGTNGDYALSDGPVDAGQSAIADYDFTSEDKPEQKQDFDFGTTTTKPEAKTANVVETKTKPEKEIHDIEPVAGAQTGEESAIEAEPSGPDDETFEEIMDLEECLDLHKTWINSGGKLGQQANRPHSDFRGQELEGADFTRAILPQSNFEKVDCTSVVLRKADLTGSTFRQALLTSADLRVSRLSQADMRDARLDRANLLGADLTGANLEGATLSGVNLSGANLNRTNLRGVNLSNCRGLISEQIQRAITDQSTLLPAGARAPS